MEELLNFLASLRDCLESQVKVFNELVPLLDREESLIAAFELADFEKIVIEKDQIAKRTQAIEERRITLMRKICYLMSYDARTGLPTLTSFITIFRNYAANVEKLIAREIYENLILQFDAICETAQKFRAMFAETAPRVYRNEKILKKLLQNFKMSIALVESDVIRSQNYDKKGKSVSKSQTADSWSSVRVKA